MPVPPYRHSYGNIVFDCSVAIKLQLTPVVKRLIVSQGRLCCDPVDHHAHDRIPEEMYLTNLCQIRDQFRPLQTVLPDCAEKENRPKPLESDGFQWSRAVLDLVEAAGIEPASASTPPLALHAYPVY